MTIEKIYSPILDKNIHKNISNSPIWEDCYHETDDKPTNKKLICYQIKFDGLIPIQVTKIGS